MFFIHSPAFMLCKKLGPYETSSDAETDSKLTTIFSFNNNVWMNAALVCCLVTSKYKHTHMGMKNTIIWFNRRCVWSALDHTQKVAKPFNWRTAFDFDAPQNLTSLTFNCLLVFPKQNIESEPKCKLVLARCQATWAVRR